MKRARLIYFLKSRFSTGFAFFMLRVFSLYLKALDALNS